MAPSLNVALDNHVGSLPSSTKMDVVCKADSMAGTIHLISPVDNEYYQVPESCWGLVQGFFSTRERQYLWQFQITVGSRTAIGTGPQLSGVLWRKRTHHRDVPSTEMCHLIFQKHWVESGPQGKKARKTIDSVRLFEWGLSRLNESTKHYGTLRQICWAAWHLTSNTFILEPSSRVKSCQCYNSAVLLETAWRKACMCCHWSA